MKTNKINKVPRTVSGSLIEVTERTCSDKLQPYVKVGRRYMVIESRNLQEGTPLLIVENPDKKGKTIRINAERFKWKLTSFDEIRAQQDETKFKAEEKMFVKMLNDRMSKEDAVTVVYVPHVVETLCVKYLLKCANFCKTHMFSEYRLVSRTVHEIEINNYNEQIKEIKIEGYKIIDAACDAYQRENSEGIKDLLASILRELKKAYPMSLPECTVKDSLRRDAIFGIILLKVLKMCYLDHDNIVASGAGELLYQQNNRLAEIEKCFRAYAGNIDKFNFNAPTIRKGLSMLKKRFTNIHFKVQY